MTTMVSARVEADVDLPAAHERREVLSGLADDLFYAEHPPTSAELDAAKIEAREVLGNLGDAEFEHRWSRVIDAARNHAAFADEKRGFELVSAGALSEDVSCGVQLEDFTEINAAVAPGQPGDLGYDLRGYADAIAAAWGWPAKSGSWTQSTRTTSRTPPGEASQGYRTSCSLSGTYMYT